MLRVSSLWICPRSPYSSMLPFRSCSVTPKARCSTVSTGEHGEQLVTLSERAVIMSLPRCSTVTLRECAVSQHVCACSCELNAVISVTLCHGNLMCAS